jgi:hypothetical protein
MRALANEAGLLIFGGDAKALKGFVQWVNPLDINVKLGQLFSV